jgi:nucleotide-binding universal stress UspA family protein
VSGVRRVIVGTSSSPGSLPALRYAAGLAWRADAPLIAVHAWVPPGGDLAERGRPSPELRVLWAKAAGERLRAALGAAWGAAAPDGLDVQAAVLRGEPGPVLVDVAWHTDDLLVVGAGRRSLLGRLRHGRVSRYCVARARCPVLAVPPPDLRRRTGLRVWSLRRRQLTVEQAMAESVAAGPGPDRR